MCFPCTVGRGVRVEMERMKSGKLVGKFKVCLGEEWETREHRQGCRRKSLLVVFFLLPTPIPPRAPSSFTQNQRQCPSLSPRSPGESHRTGPSSSWLEYML